MKTFHKLLIHTYFIIIVGVPCFAGDTVHVKKPGIYELKLSVNNEHLVNCAIRVDAFTSVMPHNRMWGSDWSDPRIIIANIKLWVNNTEVTVPLSAYADISNPNWVMLTTTGSGYRLIIRGGDGASSYHATIDFSKNSVYLRRVQWMVNPNETWQITIYSPRVDIE